MPRGTAEVAFSCLNKMNFLIRPKFDEKLLGGGGEVRDLKQDF